MNIGKLFLKDDSTLMQKIFNEILIKTCNYYSLSICNKFGNSQLQLLERIGNIEKIYIKISKKIIHTLCNELRNYTNDINELNTKSKCYNVIQEQLTGDNKNNLKCHLVYLKRINNKFIEVFDHLIKELGKYNEKFLHIQEIERNDFQDMISQFTIRDHIIEDIVLRVSLKLFNICITLQNNSVKLEL